MPALSDNGAGKPYGTAALRSGRLGPKRALTSAEEARYVRPKPWEGPTNGWPAGFHQSVWKAAKDIDGKVYDPKTGAEIKPTDAWHLGHRPGYEHRKHQQSAADRGLSREEFLNEMWHKEHYRPEVPTSNMSRTGEAPWDVYFGP